MGNKRAFGFGLFVLCAITACGDDASSKDAAVEDSGRSRVDAKAPEAVACRVDEDCNDDLFCNGTEKCVDQLCVAGKAKDCDDGIACTIDSCSDNLRACRSEPPDEDGDGHADVKCLDAKGKAMGDDCDDLDTLRFPNNIEICDSANHDEDCDPETNGELDRDHDGFFDIACCNPASDDPDAEPLCGTDCDDQKENVNTKATEACDSFDNDCDDKTDEGVTVDVYPDKDFDLHGDKDAEPETFCADQPGYAIEADDCDDSDPEVFTGQLEICDDKDNNCDGNADEKAEDAPWYADEDGDLFGDPGTAPIIQCERVEGRVLRKTDCDDGDPSVNPAAAELCDGKDNDCHNGPDYNLDTNDFEDDDGDKMADVACGAGADDCNDKNPDTGFGTDELCDGQDNDCDGAVDENVVSIVWFTDRDGDGFGDDRAPQKAYCGILPDRTATPGDCDDSDAEIKPGATEQCDNINQDCDSQTDETPADNECSFANAEDYCARGKCRIDLCLDGYSNCDGNTANGCEVAKPVCPSAPAGGTGGTGGTSGSGGTGGTGGTGGSGGTGGNGGVPIPCQGSVVAGDATIDSPAALAALAGVTCIGGSLTINSTSLTNLDGLSSLQWIGGTLSIAYNDSLQNLTGLANLTTIVGNFGIAGNAVLTTLGGLAKLTTVGGYVTIQSTNLPNLTGLDALESVGGYLQIYYNGLLTSLSGFGKLLEVGGYVQIIGNAKLMSIDGFNSLNSVREYVEIDLNPKLATIAGFGVLPEIIGNLDIHGNLVLTGITGFGNLGMVGNSVLIYTNPLLATLSGFPLLTQVSGDLRVYDNDALLTVTGFGNLTTINASLTVSDNPLLGNVSGLSSLQKVSNNLLIARNLVLTDVSGLTAALTDVGNVFSITANPDLSACQVKQVRDGATPPVDQSCCNADCNACTGMLCGTPGAGTQSGTYYGDATIAGPTDLALFDSTTKVLGSLSITGTSQVDDLLALSGLSEVTGSLTISSNPHLSSLDGLQSLTKVGGSLAISYNDQLGNMSALGSLTSVGGNMSVDSNTTLGSLAGFEALTEIKGYLNISSNSLLGNLAGLAELVDVGQYVSIYYNPQLTSLGALGLSKLKTIGLLGGLGNGYLYVLQNGLTSLNGLNALTSVAGYVEISWHPDLVAIDGLATLGSVGGDVRIFGNAELASLEGFNALPAIGGALSVYDNVKLQTIGGLNTVASVAAGMRISGNTDLAALDGFPALNTVGANLDIYSNQNMANISGLGGLDSVAGTVEIRDNAGLQQIGGLGTLVSVNNLFIRRNPTLTSILGPVMFDKVTSNLEISDNPMLTTIAGLSGLSSVDNDMRVLRNLALSDLGGMTLNTVGNTLQIAANPALSSCVVDSFTASLGTGLIGINQSCCNKGCSACTGMVCSGAFDGTSGQGGDYVGDITPQKASDLLVFDNVTGLKGNLLVQSSTLASLAGLEQLATVTGRVAISYNAMLTSLTGLTGLTTIAKLPLNSTLGDLSIDNNGALGSVFALANLGSVAGNLTVYGNAIGNLNGFGQLSTVGGDVVVQYNGNLNGMTSFITAINSVGGDVNFYGNSNLSECSVTAFVASISGYTGVTTNMANLACTTPNACSGAVCM